MRRFDAIREVVQAVRDELIVCTLGHPSQELYMIRDRPQNFYMLGSMGLASSIGLGLALSQRKKVVVIDGDGAVLMNLGTLATIAVNGPRNLVLIIIDNQAYGSTGYQASFTSHGICLAEIARACGIRKSIAVERQGTIRGTMGSILHEGDGPYCVVIKTERGNPYDLAPIPCDAVAIRDRFMRSVSE
jgi:sulfopyruvate decarboxylase subunit beta